MDTLDKAIHYAETGKPPKRVGTPTEEDNEPWKIYEAIDKLRTSPNYFLNWWSNTKEFQRSKLTRSNFIPKTEGSDEEKSIEIEVHEVNNHAGIQENT